MRCGVLAKKLGMTCLFDETGVRRSVTLLHIPNCQVIGHRTAQKDGYFAAIVGAVDAKRGAVSKSVRGICSASNVPSKKNIAEFRVEAESLPEVGATLGASHFQLKQFVDVTGTSIGKGFAGVMKRHNFGGLRASHGVSISHRSHGSTGQRTQPGKVFKGTKMAGHMGNETVTKQNLRVVYLDQERDIIGVYGSVPGHKNALIKIRDAIKKTRSGI